MVSLFLVFSRNLPIVFYSCWTNLYSSNSVKRVPFSPYPLCMPGMKPTWSCSMILLMHCWIRFTTLSTLSQTAGCIIFEDWILFYYMHFLYSFIWQWKFRLFTYLDIRMHVSLHDIYFNSWERERVQSRSAVLSGSYL
jgi:hypothetical protein